MTNTTKRTWAARLWEAREERNDKFAAVLFPVDTKSSIGFGVGSMAHRALDNACAEIGFSAAYDNGFDWPDTYRYDETFQRDCIRSENKNGDMAVIYKL